MGKTTEPEARAGKTGESASRFAGYRILRVLGREILTEEEACIGLYQLDRIIPRTTQPTEYSNILVNISPNECWSVMRSSEESVNVTVQRRTGKYLAE